MCTRVALRAPSTEVARHFGALIELSAGRTRGSGVAHDSARVGLQASGDASLLVEQALAPSVNIAPSEGVAIVRPRLVAELGELEGAFGAPRVLAVSRWGLLPTWAKDAGMGSRLVNARAETVAEKAAFRESFRAQRCLFVADAFFEWIPAAGRKQPILFRRRDGLPFAFAGLWSRWWPPSVPSDGADASPAPPLETCALITLASQGACANVHDRMPAVLEPDDFDAWLAGAASSVEALHTILGRATAAGGEDFVHYPVSPKLNDPRYKEPDALAPLEPDALAPSVVVAGGRAPRQRSLFDD